MKISEMKDIIFNKLQDENCYFTKSDISIRKVKDGYKIVIKDYEFCPFTIKEEKEDYFGFILIISIPDENILFFIDSKQKFDYECALVKLGYYIGSRF